MAGLFCKPLRAAFARAILPSTPGRAWMLAGRGSSKMRILGIVALGAALSGCAAMQRAEIAQQAQATMIGMPREKVLACMGPPAQKATEGQTEVWAYNTSPTIILNEGSGATRFCTVNIVMTG